MKKFYHFVFCLMICLALPFATANETPITIIASSDNDNDSLHLVALREFDRLVQKYSQGEMIVELHHRDSENFPAIRGEEINVNMLMNDRQDKMHISVVAAGNAAQKISILNFLTLPYIFSDIDAAKRLFKSSYMLEDINNIIAQRHNVRVLGWLIGGYRHMTNSKRPVETLEDIKDLRIRTPRNRLMRDTYTALGAKTKPLDWGQTFSALKEGSIDGQENPYNVILYSKFWEAKQKYISNNGPFLWVGPILINETFYQSLSPRLRKVLRRSGLEASEFEWQWIEQRNKGFKEALIEKGMIISELKDKSQWIDTTKHLWKEYYGIIGYQDSEEGKKIVEKVLNITE